jgi:hypothetical protein
VALREHDLKVEGKREKINEVKEALRQTLQRTGANPADGLEALLESFVVFACAACAAAVDMEGREWNRAEMLRMLDEAKAYIAKYPVDDAEHASVIKAIREGGEERVAREEKVTWH